MVGPPSVAGVQATPASSLHCRYQLRRNQVRPGNLHPSCTWPLCWCCHCSPAPAESQREAATCCGWCRQSTPLPLVLVAGHLRLPTRHPGSSQSKTYAASAPAALAGSEHLHQLIGGHVQQLVQVHALQQRAPGSGDMNSRIGSQGARPACRQLAMQRQALLRSEAPRLHSGGPRASRAGEKGQRTPAEAPRACRRPLRALGPCCRAPRSP